MHRRAIIDYQSYKPWLRDEFTFRCVYCLERERWYPSRAAAFSVDHVTPQVDDATRICDYENLVYACLRCNSSKQDILLADPTKIPFGQCLIIELDGTISALSADGADLIDVLHLNDSPVIDTRKKYLTLMKLSQEYPEDQAIRQLYVDAFGYPDDLPDLRSRRPPGGNRSKSGANSSYYDLRQQNQLGECY
jgi:hypothetical protein